MALHPERWITSLPELRQATGTAPILLLYSGGLDGTYFLCWAAEQQIPVIALQISLDESVPADPAGLRAKQFGAEFRSVNLAEEFFSDFVGPAIHGNAWYHGLYPVGSTLSRPLFAREAVRVARASGCATIVHTATFMQNTMLRIGRSIAALDPELQVAAPFAQQTLSRPEKQRVLAEHGVHIEDARHSIDENPWARVIENDTLEDPELDLPDAGVFSWTAEPADRPDQPETIELAFEHGLPVSLDGQEQPLGEIVRMLNELAGRHGIGRFSGLEGLRATGLKNHEIREAPAATVLTLAHRTLEAAVLTDEELTIKRSVDENWTTLAVGGDWFGMVPSALRGCSRAMDAATSGRVRIRLGGGQAQVLALHSPAALHYYRFGDGFSQLSQELSVRQLLSIWSLPDRLRNGPTTGAGQ